MDAGTGGEEATKGEEWGLVVVVQCGSGALRYVQVRSASERHPRGQL
jgi:hypothetical protein